MRLALDAMGGDNAPEEIVKGATEAKRMHPDLHITLVGDRSKIEPYLEGQDLFHILHTTETIEGTDSPVKAVRKRKMPPWFLPLMK